MVGVLGYPLSAAVPQSGVLRPLWAEGLAQPLPHPTLSIIHASSPVSTTWQAPQQQGQGLFTVSKCLFAGSGPLPSRLPHQSSTLQEATWVTGIEVTKLPPCPTWSMSSNFRAQDVDTLPGISCLIPALVPAEPRTVAPSFTTRDYPAPFPPPHPFSSQSPWSLERPKEGLIKDAEVGRKTEGF